MLPYQPHYQLPRASLYLPKYSQLHPQRFFEFQWYHHFPWSLPCAVFLSKNDQLTMELCIFRVIVLSTFSTIGSPVLAKVFQVCIFNPPHGGVIVWLRGCTCPLHFCFYRWCCTTGFFFALRSLANVICGFMKVFKNFGIVNSSDYTASTPTSYLPRQLDCYTIIRLIAKQDFLIDMT